ncbi:unnamed protein product [Rotaria sp. Silwood2]|nr:unnamed protein product [Rotaria sp. Silwood2]CAF4563209.1 unnamed protein product [Rotaria sp. Silwood2]
MVMRILNLLALIILLAHWNGCLQFMIPMFQNFLSDCWVALNALQNAPWTEQYTVALFKALSQYALYWLWSLNKLKNIMAWRKLPREMRNRISDYYEHCYQGKIFHKDTILNERSENLRLVLFQPGDQIIHEGTIGDKMYFIQEGVVDIIKSDGQVLTTLSDRSYFGEICLLTRAKRVAGVRCVKHIEKNPSIISTRHDLKRDAAVLKDMINRVTPQPSSDESSKEEEEQENEEEDNKSFSSSYKIKQSNFKSSLTYIHDQLNKIK